MHICADAPDVPCATVFGERKRALDEKYYEVINAGSISERMLIFARDNVYRDFLNAANPSEATTILDVGVSGVVDHGANVLERRYPYPHRITAAGLEAGDAFKKAFPRTRYVEIQPNQALPFAGKTFDIATANAVLEHVGSRQNQQRFLADLLRVSKLVIVTVPNRWFPVEHHTAIPIFHYWRSSFAFACRMTRNTKWMDPQNLILMDKTSLRELCPPGTQVSVCYTGIRFGMLSSNLMMVIRDRP